jgi:hypothetical protein
VPSLGLAIGGFQAFACASSFLALSEAAAREKLAAAHADLQAAQARLADSSRTEERLRISRDLHDTLGHHLTALSLQLEVASRVTEGTAADHIRQAHAITRLLLSDVRDVVSALREPKRVDIAQAIRELATSSSVPCHRDEHQRHDGRLSTNERPGRRHTENVRRLCGDDDHSRRGRAGSVQVSSADVDQREAGDGFDRQKRDRNGPPSRQSAGVEQYRQQRCAIIRKAATNAAPGPHRAPPAVISASGR